MGFTWKTFSSKSQEIGIEEEGRDADFCILYLVASGVYQVRKGKWVE